MVRPTNPSVRVHASRNERIRVKVMALRQCACDVHDLCACTTSHDFALTQCQWQLPMERALFGSRSIEGVHPAYVVNTLTIPLDEALLPPPPSSPPPPPPPLPASRLASTARRPPTRQPDEESNVCLRHFDLRPRGQEASLLIALRSDRLCSSRFAPVALHSVWKLTATRLILPYD